MLDVPRLARPPVLLLLTSGCIDHAIRTRMHNVRHAIAKAVANICQTRLASLIFGRIMQEPGDCHVLRASVLENCGRYREKMRDIGDGRFFAHLTAVDMGCV
jgi:hypothetical protein